RCPLRCATSLVFVAGRSMVPPPFVDLFHRRFQPHLDQMQQVPVAHSTGHRFHQLGVGNAVEVSAQVCVYHLCMSRVHQTVHFAHRVQGGAVGSIRVLLRL